MTAPVPSSPGGLREELAEALLGAGHSLRFAVENLDDPLILADADDYGTGWAAHMRAGHITVAMGDDEG